MSGASRGDREVILLEAGGVRSMRRWVWRVSGAVAACAVAGLAHAAWASPGDGIRLGGSDGRLHPFLDIETRYDTNLAYGPRGEALGDTVFHVRPGLELKIRSDLAVVEFTGSLDWAQYAGMATLDETTGKTTRELSRLFAQAGFGALFNPNGVASIRLDDDYRRQVSTSSLTFGSAVISNSNTLALSVPWKPGGGALVLNFRGQWKLESFEPYTSADTCHLNDLCSRETLGKLAYNQYRSGVEAQWRFLPRTSAVFQAGYFSHVPNSQDVVIWDALNGDQAMKVANVTGFDVLTGVTGLVTPHIGASIKAGWGQAWDSGSGEGTFLTDIGTEWIPIQGASLRVGYSRAFGIDPLAAFYTSNSMYVMGRIRMAQRYTLKAAMRYDNLSFAKADGTTNYFRVEPGVDATISPWMTASLGYSYNSRDSSLSTTGALVIPQALAFPYSKNEVWLKLGFTY